MNKIKVSQGYIEVLWSSLGEGREIDKKISGLNLNNEKSIEFLVSELLRPFICDLDLSFQFRLKESLKYAINFWEKQNFAQCYEKMLPQLVLPTECSARDFYIKIWGYLYFHEDYKIHDKLSYEEISALDIYGSC